SARGGARVKQEFLPPPEQGRRFVGHRRVRLGDVNRSNRLRLDAVARYLQDVASDDVDDVADPRVDGAWVLRRTALVLGRSPRYGDDVELTTFCSGTGGHWAERRTSLAVDGSSVAEAGAVWVYVDRAARPARPGEGFFAHYGDAADGRNVSGRLWMGPSFLLTSLVVGAWSRAGWASSGRTSRSRSRRAAPR